MKKKTIKQFVIYSRKSKFTGKGESIENQIEMCRQYIATHYSEKEAETALVYEDEGFSGGNLEMVGIRLKQNSILDGLSLIELRRKYKAQYLVCAVQRGDEVYIPDGNFVL